MVSKVGTFLSKVRETLPLLEEILDTSDHIIHKSKAVELAFRLKSIDTLSKAENLIESLLNFKPQPILVNSELIDNSISIPNQLKDLILWVTKKMHIESSHHLKAIIDDMSDQIEIIDENLHGVEMKIAVIHRSMRTIDRAREKMENLALNNLEAIEAAVRGIESSQESWSLRQEMAFELQTRHISPMSDIIDVSGVLMKTIDRCAGKLRDIEKRYDLKDDIRNMAVRLRTSLDNSSQIVTQKHESSMNQISPLLEIYINLPSEVMTGAIKALQIAENKGIKALNLSSQLYLNTWRLNDVWDDSSLEELLDSIDGYEPEISSFEMPEKAEGIVNMISVYQLVENINKNKPIEDVLQFVIDSETKAPLGTCLTSTINALVNFDGNELEFGLGVKRYQKGNSTMEAVKIGIK